MKEAKFSVKLCRPIVNLSPVSTATFWRSIVVAPDCWKWTGRKDRHGYGIMHYRNIDGTPHWTVLATRISWFLHHGEMPQDKHVLHSCDNPECVNPNHLFLGTHVDNMADRDKKGRNKVHFGQDNFQCRLTPEKVLEIRELSKQGLSSIKIGARFGVSKTSILMILNGRTWGHVQSPDSHA